MELVFHKMVVSKVFYKVVVVLKVFQH